MNSNKTQGFNDLGKPEIDFTELQSQISPPASLDSILNAFIISMELNTDIEEALAYFKSFEMHLRNPEAESPYKRIHMGLLSIFNKHGFEPEEVSRAVLKKISDLENIFKSPPSLESSEPVSN